MPRRDFSKVPFAATGDVVSIPATSQADGTVSVAQGWTYDYERDNGAGGGTPDPLAKNITRTSMNGILNEITASIGEMQQLGFSVWAASAAPYPVNAVVSYGNKNFISLIANNSATPADGASWAPFNSSVGRLTGKILMTAAGTYTPTPGTKFVVVKLVGGGGGGGGTAATSSTQYSVGGGGGGGSYSESFLTAAQVGASQSIVIGAGGIFGGIGGGIGGSGGTTSFGSLMAAPGGYGGGSATSTVTNSIAIGGSGGLTSTGGSLVNSGGMCGFPGISNAVGGSVGGAGGGTPLAGGAGGGLQGTSEVTGNAGSYYGAGGSGASTGPSGAGKRGGAGSPGAVIIEEYA